MIEYKKVEAEEVQDSQSSKIFYKSPQGNVFAEQLGQQYYMSQGFNVIWSENNYWWEVMALLFWEIIFAPIEGAVKTMNDGNEYFPFPGSEDFENNFPRFMQTNGMPYDFFTLQFYQRRRAIIDNRFRELENSNLIDKLTSSYHQHYGQNCRPIENWEKYPLDSLLAPIRYIPSTVVLGICRRLLSDFSYNRAGLPDLVAYRQDDVIFSEVKSKNDKVSQKQREWHDYLSTELSQKVEIILINHTEKQISNIKKEMEPKGGKEIKISFGSSSSKKRDEAIAFISQQKSCIVNGTEKEAIYSAIFNTIDIEPLYKMLDLTAGWKTQSVEIDGQVVKPSAIRNGLYCYRQKNQEHVSDAWCNQDAYGEGKNPFGCKRIFFNQLENNRWADHGYVDTDKGEWVFDIDKIKSDIEKQFAELQFCPLFNSDKIEKVITDLPARINPALETDWAFRGQEYNLWIFHNGNWLTRYGEDKQFPGFAVMSGIEKLSKEERSDIIRSNIPNQNIYNVSLDMPSVNQPTKKTGCFIATAVYGSYEKPQVIYFRRFRDQTLLKSPIGRLVVKCYYLISPSLSVFITKHKIIKDVTRYLLDWLLKRLIINS